MANNIRMDNRQTFRGAYMFRPFVFTSIFFIPGILLGSLCNIPATLFFAGIIGMFLSLIAKDVKTKKALIALSLLLTGAVYYNYFTQRIKGGIPEHLGNTVTMIGSVEEEPQVEKHKVSYDVLTMFLVEGKTTRQITGKIRLTVPFEKDSEVYHYKDVVKFIGELKLPAVKRNPGGIDYRSYLAQKGITAVTFSREIEKVGKLPANPFIKLAISLRRNMLSLYQRSLPQKTSALLAGICLGSKDELPKDTLRLFSDTGLSHVLAVSGLHMAVVYGAAKRLLDGVRATAGISAAAGSLIVIFYSFMAGLSPSVMRAAITIIVYLIGQGIGRKADSLNSLGLAATVLLILNPLYAFSVGFQLSFAATLGILLFFKDVKQFLNRLPGIFRDPLAVVISAQLMVSPFLVYYFNRISVGGFIANLLVVPMVGIILVTGFMSGLVGLVFPGIGAILLKIPGALLVLVEFIITLTHKLPISVATVPSLPLWSYLAYFIALAIIFWPIPRFSGKPKAAAAILLLIMAATPVFLEKGTLEVTFIDVGQGDSIFVRSPKGNTVLIDAGGTPRFFAGDYDTGSDVVMPFLYSRGTDSIDVVVVSHFDDDHAGGLVSILENIKVGLLVYGHKSDTPLYSELMEAAGANNVNVLSVGRGDEFCLDDVVFEVLGPDKNRVSESENDNSVILRLSYKGISFLFTGDLEAQGEAELISAYNDVRTFVLKVGHHGSSTSTSKEFLSRTSPAFGVISVGAQNVYGHPTSEVLERLFDNGVRVLRTDQKGGITFKIRGKDVKIYTSITEEQ